MTFLFFAYLFVLPFGIYSHYKYFKRANASGKAFEFNGHEIFLFIMTLMCPIMPLIADAMWWFQKGE